MQLNNEIIATRLIDGTTVCTVHYYPTKTERFVKVSYIKLTRKTS